MANQTDASGLSCLQALFGQFRRNVNFAALITSEVRGHYDQDNHEVIMELSQAHDLRPESSDSLDILNSYAGPAMVQLNDGHWIVLVNSVQFVKGEQAGIMDSRLNTPGKADGNWAYRITKEQLDAIPKARFLELNRMYHR